MVCIYRSLFNGEKYGLSPLTATIPAYCGKFCLVWPAILSIFGNKDINSKICFFKNDKSKASIENRVIIS